MWERLREMARSWLGADAEPPRAPVDESVRRYERAEDGITAAIAGKLAMLTFADSTFAVAQANGDTPSPRTALIERALMPLWQRDAEWITAQALGKGGMLLVPSVTASGGVQIQAVDQNRLVALEERGGQLTRAVLAADECEQRGRRYCLLASYELAPGGAQRIRYRAFSDAGAQAPLTAFAAWKDLTPEIDIADTDRLLLAHLKCPRDNRTTDRLIGVPITYGAEKLIEELNEHARIYRREFKLTRPMLGLDSSLWRDVPAAGDIRQLRRTVQDSDDPFVPFPAPTMSAGATWQYFAPDIRAEAMETRWNSLCRRLEKACGLSQGILTERPTMSYANRDEVRAAQYDTFAVVRAIRTAWEQALEDLAYAVDVLAERFALTEPGDGGGYALSFDWDLSMIESTSQTFEQLAELHARGGCTLEELRQWVMGKPGV